MCTSLIKSIQLPSLKLYLISKFVGDLNQRKMVLNPQRIEEILQQLSRNYNADNNKHNDDADMSVDVDPPPATGDYPYMKSIRKKYSSEISDREYAKLLLDALDAYADMHHFVELHKKMAPVLTGTVPHSIDVESMSKQPQKQKLKHSNDSCLRKRGQAVIERELRRAKSTRIYDVREISQELTLKSVVHILVDTELQKRYREQLKRYDIINLTKSGALKHLLGQYSKKSQ